MKDETEVLEKPKPSIHYDQAVNAAPTNYHPTGFDTPSRPASLAGTDDELEDDFDWSGEEDLVDEEAKFEQRMGIKQKRKGWGFKRILTLLFSSLVGSTLLAGVLVTPAILIHFYWYLKHPSDHRLYVKQTVQAWLFWAAANLVISWYLALMVDIIPAVVRFAVGLSWGHTSESLKTRLELFNSVKDTFKPLLYGASAWVSWVIVFANIFELVDLDQPSLSRAQYNNRVYDVIKFLFFFTLVYCVQRMLSHFIAFAFHRTAFKDRVDAVQEALQVIENLRDYRPKFTTKIPRSGIRTPLFGFNIPLTDKDHFNVVSGALRSHAAQQASADGHEADVEDGEHTVVGTGSRKSTLMGLGKGKNRMSWLGGTNRSPETPSPELEMGVYPRNTSNVNTPTGVPLNPDAHHYPPTGNNSTRSSIDHSAGDTIAQAARALKNAILHDARNIKGKETDGFLGFASVANSSEAKRLARSIYLKFRDRSSHRTYLLPADFHPAFETPELAAAAFRVFDKDNNGDISRAEIKTTLLKVYKERRSLARSMRDVSVALRTLDQILLLFAMIILCFISLSLFGVNVGSSLTSVYTLGIAASFIFKNAASNAFDAIMFLFVTHPFDTGDRCFIDNENLIVKRMGLFATVFTRVDGTESYYFNSQLFSKFITNVRRSGKMFENLTMQLAWRTPLAKLDALETCMNEWLATEENRWFQPNTSITLQHIDYQKYLEVTIGIPHNGNWQDWGIRCARKTAFHAAVQYYSRQLGIEGYEAPLPVVYLDSDTHMPLSPLPAGETGQAVDSNTDLNIKNLEKEAEQMKPSLGFLPPLAARSAHIRARKSKSKKAILRGVD
ncbi:Mechanosensitive ion channel-domain-containing protein [Mycena floridula]|nr:Mechanosensitive ion channel-domain-containing protein [Mycena floridula]